jgi:hypothetical protein
MRIATAPAAELDASASGSAPTLPTYPGVSRTGPPSLLARGNTLLGASELVAFASPHGLCVEVTHLSQRTRAGGCDLTSLPRRSNVAIVGQGYSATAGPQGITEIFGQLAPGVRSARVEFRRDGAWHRQAVLRGSLLTHRSSANDESVSGSWFASDLPGCLEGSQLRIRVFGRGGRHLGQAQGLQQHAACQQGSGYTVRGALIYGALPTQ